MIIFGWFTHTHTFFMQILSDSERKYLEDPEQFSKLKERYTRYRLRKKLRLMTEELQRCSAIAAAASQRGGYALNDSKSTSQIALDSTVLQPWQGVCTG
ncbi:MAG TPA: hypothetical protein VHJ59_01070 [Nitrososphaera sp.]|nr:hypothetical protein [Nitrososphaera sp.]